MFNTLCVILYNLLKTLAFPPAEQLWSLELDFQCGREEKAQFRPFLFRAQRFAFSHFFFFTPLGSFFWLRVRKRESAKKAPVPTSAFQKMPPD
jgi:hypothetical protein